MGQQEQVSSASPNSSTTSDPRNNEASSLGSQSRCLFPLIEISMGALVINKLLLNKHQGICVLQRRSLSFTLTAPEQG